MGILSEFRDFALKGNVVDLAVGVIIGGAFNGIVKSLVDDVIMPPIGVLIGGVDFKNLNVQLKAYGLDEKTHVWGWHNVEKATLNYGAFVNTVINFLIVAACVFLMVKLLNIAMRWRAAAPPPVAPPPLSLQEQLLTDIRDLLQKEQPR